MSKTRIGSIVLLLFFIFLAPLTIFAMEDSNQQEPIFSSLGIGVEGAISTYTRYIWRGFVQDRDAVIQPEFYISSPKTKYGKLKLGVWSNQPLQNNDNLHSEEFDYIIDYTYEFKEVGSLKSIGVSLGHIYYDFVQNKTFSREFYLGLSFPEIPLSPSLFYYRDYGDSNSGGGLGNYILLNAEYSLPIKHTPFIANFTGHAGYNHNLFINGDGLDIGLKAGLNIALAKNLNFSPSVNYSIPFGDLADNDRGGQKESFFAGGTLDFIF